MSWLPKKSVVVPVDFSEASFDAVRTARELVELAGALHVVHVLPVLQATEPGVIWDTINDPSRIEHAEAALREKLSGDDLAGIDVRIVIGNPGSEIAATAEQCEADLIVLPSHGRSGLSRILLGSVAERVVRLAHCPVLVIREQ